MVKAEITRLVDHSIIKKILKVEVQSTTKIGLNNKIIMSSVRKTINSWEKNVNSMFQSP